MIPVARTDFSIGESILSVKDYVTTAAGLGHTVLGIADTMTVSGMVEFSKLCEAHHIRPLIGCRLRVVEDASYRHGKAKAPKEVYPMVWPKNQEGFEQLLELLTIATDGEHFYYKPRLSMWEVLDAVREDNLIMTTGDIQALPEHDKMWVAALTVLEPYQLWGQFTIHEGPYFKALAKKTGKDMELYFGEGNCDFVHTRPVLYPEGKHEAFDTMNAIIKRATVSSPWRNVIAYHDLHVPVKSGWEGPFLEELNFKFERRDISLPDMSVDGKDEFSMLKEKCIAGWAKRLKNPVMGYKPSLAQQTEYMTRLKYELGVIREMGFERYFLLVEDLVRWSKSQDIIVGPGRGSVGGSLVAYLLGITDVDPIRFGLLFERFINPDRLDLPDADLDFQSSRRHEVIEYLKRRYGEEKVAGIINFNSIVSKGAIRDVGRVFEIPPKVLFISKLVPDTYGTSHTLEAAREEVAAIDDFARRNPDAWRNACDLQGVQRSLGRHAAGVIVAGEPLIKRAVVDHSKDEPAVGWDKRSVEDMGLIKLDILGLSNLDVLSLALGYIAERHEEAVDLYQIPLDDKQTLEAFARGETAGVFQFESAGMRKLLTDLALGSGKLTFDDLTAATSLYRPGPKDSGLLDDYVAIKQGLKMPSYGHAALEKALNETQGVTIYQEQVSKIAQYLCGFNGAEADHLRKAMGKKDPEAMHKWEERFIQGAMDRSGYPEVSAKHLFKQIEMFAGYAFNKSHAVEYTVISFWTMYLKVHYPAEFFAATLSVLKEEKLEGLVREAEKHGIGVVPPCINVSTNRFEIVDMPDGQTWLVIPFNRVKQISDKTANHLIEVREAGGPFLDYADLELRTTGRTFNKRHKENLHKVGGFAIFFLDEPDAMDESRRKDQVELMPGLITAVVKADRGISIDTKTRNRLVNEVVKPCMDCKKCDLSGGVHPVPRLGSEAKFMVITDCPNFSEEADNKMLSGKASNYVREALKSNGLKVNEGYFTSLVKSPKSEKVVTNEQINGCKEWLQKEMEILKPPIIVLLGNSTIRELAPEVKPGMESAGRVIYKPDTDASMIIGFNPASITFDGSKQDVLNEIFERVKEMVS